MPNRAPLLPCYDNLPETLDTAWQILVRGAADRRSPCHTPVVGTTGRDGQPRLRTMILRNANPQGRLLRVHTDIRAEKWADMQADNRISALFYDAGMKVQLRIEGRASLHHQDDVAKAAWAASLRMSRACYAIAPATGSPLAEGGDFILPEPTDEAVAPGEAHFGVVIITMRSLEWLYLAAEGHRRALFTWDDAGNPTSQWLVP